MVTPEVRQLAQRTLDRLYGSRWVARAPRNVTENCLLTAIGQLNESGAPVMELRTELRRRIPDLGMRSLAQWNDQQIRFEPIEELLLSIINDEES